MSKLYAIQLNNGTFGGGKHSEPWTFIREHDAQLIADSVDAKVVELAPLVPLEKWEAYVRAADTMFNRYVDLVNSGDAGFWDVEKEEDVIAYRAAKAGLEACNG